MFLIDSRDICNFVTIHDQERVDKHMYQVREHRKGE